MSTHVDQPRTPAGSPQGGQFAPNPGGAEASLTLSHGIPMRNLARNFAYRAHQRATAMNTLRIEHAQEAVGDTANLAKTICTHTATISWEWCGDGDAPTTMGPPQVTCPHNQHTNPGESLYDFAQSHSITDPITLNNIDEVGANLDQHDLRQVAQKHPNTCDYQYGRFTITTPPTQA